MKALGDVELKLSQLGVNNRFLGKAEIKELRHVLTDDEIITNAVNGRYDNGFCLIVATDHRLLLIDRKMWFLSMEDVRFDMITEVDYCARLLDATLSVRTINKVMRVTAFKQKLLRELTSYLQARVMELRHMAVQAQQEQAMAAQPVSYTLQPISYAAVAPAAPAPQQSVALAAVEPQQLYATQIATPKPHKFKRIGAYPTSSLTTQHRF